MYHAALKTVTTAVHRVDQRIAVIILLYFSISLTNIALKHEVEWFPLFSFKFFSRIPNGFTKYDIVFDQGSSKERYLLYRNVTLNMLERRNYERWLGTTATRPFDIAGYEHLLNGATTASLVRFTGDFIEAAKYSKFDTEIVMTIK
jgi:hypothetical protein